MDQTLVNVFEQARKVVADADRKIAEEEERRRENEKERLLLELGARIEDSFDFTSKEKLELEPRLDVQDGLGVVEFVVRRVRAIFLLSPNDGNTWTLRVLEDGQKLQTISEFQGGSKTEQGSRRLAAARIVTMIGNWAQVGNWAQTAKEPQVVLSPKQPPRWNVRDESTSESRNESKNESKRELTYGTMGKFLGY